MKIAVLGTGMVGNAIGSKLISLGHEVKMGSRTATNEKAVEWTKGAGSKASCGTFADAAAFGEILFNCTSGLGSLQAIKEAGDKNLNGKILIDIANPLDFSNGMPPSLSIVNTDSLGEAIQRNHPELKVVKTLNTMNCNLMVNPGLLPGDHNVFVSGNDKSAKDKVKDLLKTFGWKTENMIDLGDITTARGTEQLLPIWVRLYGSLQNPMFNFKIVVGEAPKK
jgi:hypothetical protein